jgi:molybdate transport system ATP-binding protein
MINIDISKTLNGNEGDMELKVKLDIKEHDYVAIAGESGSGKTTLLRILAGLEDAKGSIKVSQKLWHDGQNSLPPQKREIGFVFQDYALFNNMSVEQNLLYVNKDKELSNHLLDLTQLHSLKHRFVNTLSGGQKQRVALCRALMKRPKILLMDEPLSALDPQMRIKLQNDILKLHKEFKTTTIMVSHDPSEIYHLASRVVVLDHGMIVDDGRPKDILLKTNGSNKFSFEGKLLDIIKVDVINIAVVAIGQQLVEVVVGFDEIKNLKIGSDVTISTKAFSPTLIKG